MFLWSFSVLPSKMLTLLMSVSFGEACSAACAKHERLAMTASKAITIVFDFSLFSYF
jgi:hypothetical protein